MKKEQRTLMISAFINLLVLILKIGSGILFNCYTIIADGIFTLSDFITDFLAMIGARVGKKRANKKYPFGYGRFEYIMQIFIGMVILFVGFYLGFRSFFIEAQPANLNILLIVILVILLKGLSANYLMQMGKEISSLILVNSAKESFLDVISSVMVFFVVIIGQWFSVVDIIGSIIIALLILFEGGKIIFDNVILLIGEDDNNIKIKNSLKKIINEEKDIQYADSFLIKNGSYYQATIEIAVNESITVKKLLKMEFKIKNKIKKSKLNIRFVEFTIIKK